MKDRERVVVVGAGGMLGRAFFEALTEASGQYDLNVFAREDCDVRELADIERSIDTETSIVINCAAWTDVDGAEENREAAFELNHRAPQELARHCAKIGANLVHFSTDYVFDGESEVPYAIDAPTKPLNIYGESKLAGEVAIRESGCAHLIIRTSWLFAPWGKNFVRTMLRLGAERDLLRVVDDQVGRPTSCQDLAHATLKLLAQGRRGTFHVANEGQASWYAFARAIMKEAGLSCEIVPCTSSEYQTAALRPRCSVLDLSKLARCEPPIALRPWQEALRFVLASLPVVDPD